tara:strand:+ start:602 stop:814 length:213 start_codon:yes stop_codon:yes gene_type:complete
MITSIIIFTILIIFVYTYTIKLNDDQNKIKENLESYAQKKEAGEQKPKVLVKRKKTRTRNKKESVDVHAL